MGLTDWLFGSTPGQQAGQAVKEVVTGIFDGIDTIIDDFHLAPDKALEAKIKFAEMKLGTLKAITEDIQSARAMQIQTKSWWPGILSAMSLAGFFSVLYVLIMHGLPQGMAPEDKTLVNTLIGALIGALTTVFTFWMGKNSGSDDTRVMLYHSTPPSKKEGA